MRICLRIFESLFTMLSLLARKAIRPIALFAVLVLALPVVGAGPASAATRGLGVPTLPATKSVPVAAVTSHYKKATPMPSWQAPKPTWPSGSVTAQLSGSLKAAGTLPISLADVAPVTAHASGESVNASTSAPSSAAVTIEPKTAASAADVNGVLLSVARADGSAQPGRISISLSYAQFQYAFGADWAQRLALVALPPCALTTPNVATCRVQTPVEFTNDGAAKTLKATVSLPAAKAVSPAAASGTKPGSAALVLAATSTSSSDAGSGGGDFTATTLKPAGSWSAGGATDAFTWSYPISVPKAPGGFSPSLALSYDSQSVDGLTSNTNNQAGVVGDGWGLTDSYIERSYSSCHQNPSGSTQTWDNCWSSNNELTVDLDGQTSTLVKDDATGAYHPMDDSNERVQYETGATNGAQNGEYWVVTTSNGTEYYFGLNQLPGYASGDATTDSVQTEPVYATASGQPCYNATFSSSYCEQAYRWNLDYVVDTHGDAVSYWYTTSTNYYAQDNGTTAPSTSAYTRDSVLSKIEYGQRSSSMYSATPAAEVQLTYNGRCSTSSTGCATSTLSTSTASSWPDVPYDQNCASAAKCSSQSPSFWTEDELTGIQTLVLDGTALDAVDSWALTYSFPTIPGASKGDTSTPSLWLSTVAQTGHDTTAEPSGGSAITLPSVTFTGIPLQNRVNLSEGYPWITRYRMSQITTETGEQITVNYSAPACGSGTPSNDAQNLALCYPAFWYPTGDSKPIEDYFNVYIVNSVTEFDATGGSGNDTIDTTYTPVGNPAWHYDDNPLTPADQATWDQFRGYQGMIVSTGTAPDPVTKTEYTYFQGMNGDYLSSTSTRSVSVTDSRKDTPVPDDDQYAGMTYETQVFNGSALVTDTIDTPWSSSATATHTLPNGLPSQQSFITGQAKEQIYTPLASGTTQETETDYTHDSYGRVTEVNALGDVTQPSQNTCTTTTYADNTSLWILDLAAEVTTVSVNCSTTPSLPADAVLQTLTFYDGSSTAGAAPTVGNVTMTQKASSYTGSTPNYTTMSKTSYDEYGRTTSNTDADGYTTTTAYTPATGAAPTAETVTDPMGMSTTTNYDPLRDVTTQATDAAGHITTEQYDALGRLTAVYRPGQAASTNEPDLKYTYTVSSGAPSVVDTYSLNDDGTYRVSEAIYDSMLRQREVQAQVVGGGRDITDTYYNTDGWTSEATEPYFDSAAVSTTFVQAAPGNVPAATSYTYDGDGRKTAAIEDGQHTWETTYSYGGDFVTTVPPAGGTAETTVTNALGDETDLIQYLAGEPTNYVTDSPADYTDTKYTYYPTGKQASETDAAGDQWSWQYNLLGQETKDVDPDTGATTSTYDNDGNLVTTLDARNKQITYTYDKDGRKTAEYDTTATQTLSSSNEVASWTFDTVEKGMPTASTSYSNGDSYTTAVVAYDTLGKVEASKVTLTGTDAALVPSSGLTTSYGYTLTGNLSTQTDPAEDGLPEESLSYSYDEFGQPTGLKSSGGATWQYVSAIAYDDYGKPLLYTMPTTGGSVSAQLTYDPQTSNLTDVKTTDSTDSSVVDDLSYTYGSSSGSTVSQGSGLVTEIQDKQNGGSTVDTQCFTYDYAQRLQQAWTATDGCAATPSPGDSATVGGTDAPYWQSWTYDAAGDRLTEIDHDTTGDTANDTTTDYNYPAAGTAQTDTLTSTTATGPNASQDSATYQYDAAGNTTSITGGASGNQTLSWNDQGKVQSDVTSAGTTSYVYDSSGNQTVVRDPGSTTFYDGDSQLTDTAGVLSGVRYYTVGGATIAERTSAGAVSDLIPDRQGTDELAIATTAAQTVSRRQYLPFGQARGTTGAWVGGTKGYVGGTADPTTGLENLGAREYDANNGRFLSADPIVETTDPTQLGGYDYSANDPVTGSDPTGNMFPEGDAPGASPRNPCAGFPASGYNCSDKDDFQTQADKHGTAPEKIADTYRELLGHLIANSWNAIGNGYAAKLLNHYLDNTGTDLNIYNSHEYEDNQYFADEVNSLTVSSVSTHGSFSSGWTRFNFDPASGTPGFDGQDPFSDERDDAWAFGWVNLKVSGSVGPVLANGDRLVSETVQFDSTYQFRSDSKSSLLQPLAMLNVDGQASPFKYRVFENVQYTLAPNGQLTPVISDPTQVHPWNSGPVNSGTPNSGGPGTPQGPQPSPEPMPAPTP